MNKITKIALVLLVCALLLGVGGVVMTVGDINEGKEINIPTIGGGNKESSFCDPLNDPGCPPPCTPWPGCWVKDP